jgi:chromosome segregation ATPase
VPDSHDDIETRGSILEREIVQLREQVALAVSDAGAARVLAGGADHDVSEVRAELRGHMRILNALRETQLELDRKVDGVDLRVAGLEQKVTNLDQKMTQGFTMLSTGMAQITALLTGNAGPRQN